jgi:geranylgeranyl reductase family protein
VTEAYDVVVVGAGPGGSSAAYYLARRNLRVLMVDKADFPRDKTCGDGLTPRALAVLDDMGLLDQLSQTSCRINGVEIYAPNGHSVASPIAARDGRHAFMLVVPRLKLDDVLRQHALAAGAAFEPRVHVTGVVTENGGVTIAGERDGHSVTYTARAAVIAPGANMRLLLRMGVLQQTPPTMVAARAYYEDLNVLTDRVQLRFDGVPLPGYAWVFPTAPRTANVGAGYFAAGRTHQRGIPSPQDAFESFARHSRLSSTLAQARRVSPVKGFPLRVDFLTAPTFAGRALLVGEAAGLVNPLSGEGIDYALESGRVAAEHLAGMFECADFSPARFAAYDRALREKYQSLFEFCHRVRETFHHPLWLNVLVGLASRRADLKQLLIRVVLGDQPPPRSFSYWKLLKALAGLGRK